MVLNNKELTFYINNFAYTVNIGPDLDNELEDGLKKYLDLSKDISTQELLLAYMKKTQELIYLKKDIENQIQGLENFNLKL